MNISKQKIDTIDLLANCNTISMTVDTIDSESHTDTRGIRNTVVLQVLEYSVD